MPLRGISRSALEEELRAVNAKLSTHPLASAPVKEAHALVATMQGADKTEVSKRLSDKGLPSLDELGSLQLKGSVSWWRLNRRKNKLEKKLEEESE